ncbi:hypothetical protein Tco_1023171 [Tanacetum coccineum]
MYPVITEEYRMALEAAKPKLKAFLLTPNIPKTNYSMLERSTGIARVTKATLGPDAVTKEYIRDEGVAAELLRIRAEEHLWKFARTVTVEVESYDMNYCKNHFF